MQTSLWPVPLVHVEPRSRDESADLWATGEDHAGHRWALRSTRGNRRDAPLIEWFCYRLCDALRIAQPGYAVCQTPDGELVFGSRWEEDAWQFMPQRHTTLELEARMREAAQDIASMLVVDAFLPNDDRHVCNILFRRIGQRWRALAFDWSRARWFEPWPWENDCNSEQVVLWLRSLGLLDDQAARRCAQAIESLGASVVLDALMTAPEPWRDNFDPRAAGDWWQQNAAARARKALSILGLPP